MKRRSHDKNRVRYWLVARYNVIDRFRRWTAA